MKICTARLTSCGAYSQSRQHRLPKAFEKEKADEYEKRTWRAKAHVENGEIVIPPMAFKQALEVAAKRLSISIPGKGKQTYTKNFLSGVLVMETLPTGHKIDDNPGEWINCNSDGVRGSGKRVLRCFPTIPDWTGLQKFYVLDDVIDRDTFEQVLREAGSFVGIGRFRPANGGYYGRFTAEIVGWDEQ